MKIPVIGLGGIATGEDAAEFLIAGRQRGGSGHGDVLGSALALAHRARNWRTFLRREKIARAGRSGGHAENVKAVGKAPPRPVRAQLRDIQRRSRGPGPLAFLWGEAWQAASHVLVAGLLCASSFSGFARAMAGEDRKAPQEFRPAICSAARAA